MSSDGQEFATASKTFVDWAKSRGVELSPNAELADFRDQGQGRGLKAIETIAKGEQIVRVPFKAMVAAPESLQEELGDVPALIVHLLKLSTDPSNEYKPYFDVLPRKLDTPMFWTSQEITTLLKGSFLPEKIGADEAEELWTSLCQGILATPEYASADKSNAGFHRMGSLILAYAYDIPAEPSANGEADDEEDNAVYVKALMPLVDMINHSSKGFNAKLILSDDAIEIVATKDISKDSQVYISYGQLPSSDLLRRFGFVEESGSDYETAEIGLDHLVAAAEKILASDAADLPKRVKKLRHYVSEDELAEIEDFEVDGQPEIELLAAANALGSPLTSRAQYEEAVDKAEEEQLTPAARDILLKTLEARIGEYPELDKLPTSNLKERMASQVLKSEVEVLRRTEDWVRGASTKKRRTSTDSPN